MYFQITTQVEIGSRKERCLLQAPLSVVFFVPINPLVVYGEVKNICNKR